MTCENLALIYSLANRPLLNVKQASSFFNMLFNIIVVVAARVVAVVVAVMVVIPMAMVVMMW